MINTLVPAVVAGSVHFRIKNVFLPRDMLYWTARRIFNIIIYIRILIGSPEATSPVSDFDSEYVLKLVFFMIHFK